MSTKILCFLTTILLSSSTALLAGNNAEMVYADGSKDTIPFSTIQNVIFVNNEGKTTLTVNLNNGESITGVSSMFFIEESVNGINNLFNYDNAITLYPSPVFDRLHIIGAGENPQVSITNANGVVIKETRGNEVEVSSLAEGFYIISVENKYVRFFKKNK